MDFVEGMLLHVHVLAVVAMLLKPKTAPVVYRFFKMLVVALIVWTAVVALNDGQWTALRVALFVPALIVALVFLHDEMRYLLRHVGVRFGLLTTNTLAEDVKEAVLEAVESLAQTHTGAIIAFERGDRLEMYLKTAYLLDAAVTEELLKTVFIPKGPLHDGGVVIKGNRIVAAGAYFPSSERDDIPKHLGSRHRAAIGLSDATDALTLMVSEEDGRVSVAINGYFDEDISRESLALYIEKYLQN